MGPDILSSTNLLQQKPAVQIYCHRQDQQRDQQQPSIQQGFSRSRRVRRRWMTSSDSISSSSTATIISCAALTVLLHFHRLKQLPHGAAHGQRRRRGCAALGAASGRLCHRHMGQKRAGCEGADVSAAELRHAGRNSVAHMGCVLANLDWPVGKSTGAPAVKAASGTRPRLQSGMAISRSAGP